MKTLLSILTILISVGAFADDGSWSQIKVSGVKYKVEMTSPPTIIRNVPTPISVSVQSSASESLTVVVGVVVNGLKEEFCEIPITGASTKINTIFCYPLFSTAGTQTLFVDVKDQNLPKNYPLLTCTDVPTTETCPTTQVTAVCSQFPEGSIQYNKCISYPTSYKTCQIAYPRIQGCSGQYTIQVQ